MKKHQEIADQICIRGKSTTPLAGWPYVIVHPQIQACFRESLVQLLHAAWLAYDDQVLDTGETRRRQVATIGGSKNKIEPTVCVCIGTRENSGGWLISAMLSAHSGWPLTPLNNDPVATQNSADWSAEQTIGVRSSIRHGYFRTLDLKTARTVQLSTGSLEVPAVEAVGLDHGVTAKAACKAAVESLPIQTSNTVGSCTQSRAGVLQ